MSAAFPPTYPELGSSFPTLSAFLDAVRAAPLFAPQAEEENGVSWSANEAALLDDDSTLVVREGRNQTATVTCRLRYRKPGRRKPGERKKKDNELCKFTVSAGFDSDSSSFLVSDSKPHSFHAHRVEVEVSNRRTELALAEAAAQASQDVRESSPAADAPTFPSSTRSSSHPSQPPRHPLRDPKTGAFMRLSSVDIESEAGAQNHAESAEALPFTIPLLPPSTSRFHHKQKRRRNEPMCEHDSDEAWEVWRALMSDEDGDGHRDGKRRRFETEAIRAMSGFGALRVWGWWDGEGPRSEEDLNEVEQVEKEESFRQSFRDDEGLPSSNPSVECLRSDPDFVPEFRPPSPPSPPPRKVRGRGRARGSQSGQTSPTTAKSGRPTRRSARRSTVEEQAADGEEETKDQAENKEEDGALAFSTTTSSPIPFLPTLASRAATFFSRPERVELLNHHSTSPLFPSIATHLQPSHTLPLTTMTFVSSPTSTAFSPISPSFTSFAFSPSNTLVSTTSPDTFSSHLPPNALGLSSPSALSTLPVQPAAASSPTSSKPPVVYKKRSVPPPPPPLQLHTSKIDRDAVEARRSGGLASGRNDGDGGRAKGRRPAGEADALEALLELGGSPLSPQQRHDLLVNASEPPSGLLRPVSTSFPSPEIQSFPSVAPPSPVSPSTDRPVLPPPRHLKPKPPSSPSLSPPVSSRPSLSFPPSSAQASTSALAFRPRLSTAPTSGSNSGRRGGRSARQAIAAASARGTELQALRPVEEAVTDAEVEELKERLYGRGGDREAFALDSLYSPGFLSVKISHLSSSDPTFVAPACLSPPNASPFLRLLASRPKPPHHRLPTLQSFPSHHASDAVITAASDPRTLFALEYLYGRPVGDVGELVFLEKREKAVWRLVRTMAGIAEVNERIRRLGEDRDAASGWRSRR